MADDTGHVGHAWHKHDSQVNLACHDACVMTRCRSLWHAKIPCASTIASESVATLNVTHQCRAAACQRMGKQLEMLGLCCTWRARVRASMVAASRWLLASSSSSRLQGTSAKAAKATLAFSPPLKSPETRIAVGPVMHCGTEL